MGDNEIQDIRCDCGMAINGAMPYVQVEEGGVLWHGNAKGGGHRAYPPDYKGQPDSEAHSWPSEPCLPSVDFTSHGQVNRVELIDHRSSSGKPGRVFTSMNVENIMVSIQDGGHTLKVFIS